MNGSRIAFPPLIAQQHQLNEALGQVALRALLQRETRFRLSHSFAQAAFSQSSDLMTLALQVGWLNQVGISATTGEKIYAFYHPRSRNIIVYECHKLWSYCAQQMSYIEFSNAWYQGRLKS